MPSPCPGTPGFLWLCPAQLLSVPGVKCALSSVMGELEFPHLPHPAQQQSLGCSVSELWCPQQSHAGNAQVPQVEGACTWQGPWCGPPSLCPMSSPYSACLGSPTAATSPPRLQVSPHHLHCRTSRVLRRVLWSGVCSGGPFVWLTLSWAALLCTKWMFSFRLCWGWREGGQRRGPHGSAKTPPAGSKLWESPSQHPQDLHHPSIAHQRSREAHLHLLVQLPQLASVSLQVLFHIRALEELQSAMPPSTRSLPHHSQLMGGRAGENCWGRVKGLASPRQPGRSVEEPPQPVALGTGWPCPWGAMVSHFVCQLLQLCGQIQEASLGHVLIQLEKAETEP